MPSSPLTYFALLAAILQIFLIYLTLCRRSLGPVHRAFVGVLSALALWNVGGFLESLDRGSRAFAVLAFLGALAVGPSALAFAAAYLERPIRLLKLFYWLAACSAMVLIVNPAQLAWTTTTTNAWRGYMIVYLLFFIGWALLLLLLALRTAAGRVRRRHYAYLLLISLFSFAGGLTELLAGLGVAVPTLGGAASALWAALLGYAILRHRLIALPLERRAFLGYAAALLLVVVLAVLLAHGAHQLEAAILALAVLPLFYFAMTGARRPRLAWLGVQAKAPALDADSLREDFAARLRECHEASEIVEAWRAFAAGLFPDAACRLERIEEASWQALEGALPACRGLFSMECLERAGLEHEALLSGRHTPLGRAAYELRRLLADREADVASAAPGRRDAPWLLLSTSGPAPLSLAESETRALRALAQETAAALFRTDLLEKLRRADRLSMAGAIAARVAHEIKNPLGAIAGAVQVLQQQLDSTHPGRDFLAMIADEVRRLDGIVRDYLRFSRPRPPQPARLELRPLIEKVLTALSALPDWRMKVEWDWPDALPAVAADPAQLAQVFHNLLQNAHHACGGAGALRLSARRDEIDGLPVLRVEISDDGCGMEAETLAHAFQPFFTTRARGSGLGLAVSRELLEAMGGRIALLSQPGRGSTARLDLPCDREEP